MENGMNYLWFHHQDKMQGGSDVRYGRMTGTGQGANIFDDFVDPELDHKTHKVADRVSENLNIIANDASLAFFRIQEHVRKTLPHLVEHKHEVQEIQQQVQGASFDTEYATNAVKTMHGSGTHFQNIQDLLKNAMFMKQQIDYEENRRKQDNIQPRMYSPKHTETAIGPPTSATMVDSTDSSLGQSGHEQLPDDEVGVVATEEVLQQGAQSMTRPTSHSQSRPVSHVITVENRRIY